MVCSYIYVTLKKYGYIDDDNKNVGMLLKPVLPNLIALVFALAAVLVRIVFDHLTTKTTLRWNKDKNIFFKCLCCTAKDFIVSMAFN